MADVIEKDDEKLEDNLDAGVDDASQDEPVVDEADKSIETSDEDNESEDETDKESEEEEVFTKRFTQFKGETPEEYIENLESGYENSSKEALRLKEERDEWRAKAMAKIANPEEDLEAEEVIPKTPAETWAETKMQQEWVAQYKEFVADPDHSIIEQDKEFFERFDKKTGDFSRFIMQTEGRMPDLRESMQLAWDYLMKDNRTMKEEKVAQAAKAAGSSSRSSSSPKEKQKPQFTDEQIETARRFDPSLREKSRAEIETELAKYVK